MMKIILSPFTVFILIFLFTLSIFSSANLNRYYLQQLSSGSNTIRETPIPNNHSDLQQLSNGSNAIRETSIPNNHSESKNVSLKSQYADIITSIRRRPQSTYNINAGDGHQRRLEFVHIPKTGGTAIETEAAKQNISWGCCHFLGTKQSRINSKNLTTCPDAPSTKLKKPKKIYGVPHWHLPPRYFEMRDRYSYNPYENATLFTVVRNPYERLISEYYYFQTEVIPNQSESKINDVERMNTWFAGLFTKLKFVRRGVIGLQPNTTAKLGDEYYYFAMGHVIPQYDFVYDGETRIIEHVLHFESLGEEFSLLMKEYGLGVVLPPKKAGSGRVSRKKLGLANLTLENIRLIESYYGRDFAAFGYDTISAVLENQYIPGDRI